jgi:type IV secretion system protein VirB4
MSRTTAQHRRDDVPASVQIPYRAHVAPRVISTAGGDLLMAWRLGGIAFECADDGSINASHERLNAWLRSIATPELALWLHVVRRRETRLHAADSAPGFAGTLLTKYRRRLEQETLWVNELYVTAVYRPLASQLAGAAHRLASRRDHEETGRARASALATAAKIGRQIEASLGAYDPVPLGCFDRAGRTYSTLLAFLAMLVNGVDDPVPVAHASLDSTLCTSRLIFGWETIEYRLPTSTRYGACLGIKEYPSPTIPGQLDRLLTVPFAFVLTQSFAFLSKATAMGLLSRQMHRMRNAADAAISQAAALKVALDQLAGNEFVMGDHHLVLQLLTQSRPAERVEADVPRAVSELEQAIAAARTIFGDAGIITAREDLALEAAFWSQLPGNFAARTRRAPITSRNLAGLAPMHNFPLGRASGNHWGDALAVLKTSAGSPYHFSLHASDARDPDGGSRRDTGHTFICGPTGSGKTVFLGFCLCLMRKHGATQVVFDKDHGLELLVRACGGRYLAFQRGAPTGCNPLELPSTLANRAFLRDWLRELIQSAVRALSVREELELDQALDGVLQLEPSRRNLSRLLEFLDPTEPGGTYARLAPWCAATGGEFAAVFDSGRDAVVQLLAEAATLGFDMTDVIDDPSVRGPLTRYLFHLVETLLDGRRLVVWLDEFAKLLGDRGFSALAVDGTKTWRKRNGVIVFATQSASDVLTSPIARTLVEQTPTKIFFPNADAHRDDYIRGLGFTEREFALIRSELTPGSRRFLIKQGRDAVVAELDLKGFDGELKVISARANTVAEARQLIALHGEDPARWLAQFLGDVPSDGDKEVP